MTTPKLAPCPFCNAHILDLQSPGLDGNPRYQHPRHEACPIEGHMFGGEGFAERWNRRTPDPSLVVVRRERVVIWAAEWDDLITSVIRKSGPRDRYIHDHNCIAEIRALIAQPAEGCETP